MDAVDDKILDVLRENGRASFSEVGRRVGLISRTYLRFCTPSLFFWPFLPDTTSLSMVWRR